MMWGWGSGFGWMGWIGWLAMIVIAVTLVVIAAAAIVAVSRGTDSRRVPRGRATRPPRCSPSGSLAARSTRRSTNTGAPS